MGQNRPICGKRGQPLRRPKHLYTDRGYDHETYRDQVRRFEIPAGVNGVQYDGRCAVPGVGYACPGRRTAALAPVAAAWPESPARDLWLSFAGAV
jgi:hypothetical protein